ncbi:hypothetical protein BU16DRAFT_370488 [Lophium mytilinum]|uniref:C2H2-type domain-containing protein n=1 Tax=Lophium mytilinum TaxID=390894 RepID=A0A6A6QYS0_9PEZI|nr:hypothetical protein BU16DRAFT_370488 [Lophium mytilinum]
MSSFQLPKDTWWYTRTDDILRPDGQIDGQARTCRRCRVFRLTTANEFYRHDAECEIAASRRVPETLPVRPAKPAEECEEVDPLNHLKSAVAKASPISSPIEDESRTICQTCGFRGKSRNELFRHIAEGHEGKNWIEPTSKASRTPLFTNYAREKLGCPCCGFSGKSRDESLDHVAECLGSNWDVLESAVPEIPLVSYADPDRITQRHEDGGSA